MWTNYKPTMNNNWERYWMSVVIRDDWYDTYKNWTRKRKVLCKCDCWKEYSTRINNLRNWNTLSCWCYNDKKSFIHWLNRTRIQRIFNWIQQRCINSNVTHYNYYWWRWIKCEWKNLSDFNKDMWESYFKWATIERIDNNWNYSKDNCKWATMKEQAKNRRHKVFIEYKWITNSKTEWAKSFWLSYHTFKQRLVRCGWFENMILHFNLNI